MKRMRKITAFVISAVMLLSLLMFAASCGGGNKSDGSGDITYSITVTRTSGNAFDNMAVYIYDAKGNSYDMDYTDGDGKLSFMAPRGTYTFRFDVPEGYKDVDNYTVTADQPEKTFKLSASLISTAAEANKKYKIGDVMHDFTYIDTLGREGSLSKLFETKKAVMLNFWYINCPNCITEFPDIAEAYKGYESKLTVLGINVYDTSSAIEPFRKDVNDEYDWDELPFTMVGNDCETAATLTGQFGVTGFPTTVIIDREGVVCLLAAGTGKKTEFEEMFALYTADDYKQKIYFPGTESLDVPDVDAPSSAEVGAAINASGFTAEYSFDDDKYNWPWVVDGSTLKTSSAGHNNAYAIMNAKVTAAAGQVIAFDYKTSVEENYDYFYVMVDSVVAYTYTGKMNDWKTCYAFVADVAGTYTISFVYVKDGSGADGDDTVYIKNMRFAAISDITERTEIIYRCATGEKTSTTKYGSYITPVYNEADGYYHVGDKNGPLVIADLMNSTNWDGASAWSYIVSGTTIKADLDGDGINEDCTDAFTDFAKYSNSSRKYGMIAVTKELRLCLEALVAKVDTASYANEWLELCYYFRVYGGKAGEQVDDPTRGLADYTAYDAVVNTGSGAKVKNKVNKETIIVPRGLWYRFVPAKTGIYTIYSVGEIDSYCWVADEKGKIFAENDDWDPDIYNGSDKEAMNFCLTRHFDKDKTYYVLVDFNNVNEMGEFEFCIDYVAEHGSIWTAASAGEYELVLDKDGNVTGIKLGGAVEYVLGDDKVYHVGSKTGPMLYVNLATPTLMFTSVSISAVVDQYCYYCKNCGYKYNDTVANFESKDEPFCTACGNRTKTKFAKVKMFELPEPELDDDGGIDITAFYFDDGSVQVVPVYVLNTNVAHDSKNYLTMLQQYGLKFTDYTDKIKEYVAASKVEANAPKATDEVLADGVKHTGYVPATEELVDILEKFIIFGDYSYSPSIQNAWLMLARYFAEI